MKRKGWIILAVVAVVVLGAYSWLKGSYNDMVSRSEAATAQLGNIENQYQRRADLIPNLVSTVKGYAAHEQNTLEQVVEARAKATQTRIDVNDAAAMARFDQAQGVASSALSRLMAISESYPDLKANQNFLDLQTQEGDGKPDCRRTAQSTMPRSSSTPIKKFPRNLLAGMSGFAPDRLFRSATRFGSRPKVEF